MLCEVAHILITCLAVALMLIVAAFGVAVIPISCPVVTLNFILAPSGVAHILTLVPLSLAIGALCGCSYMYLVPFVVTRVSFVINAFGVARILIFAALGVALIFL